MSLEQGVLSLFWLRMASTVPQQNTHFPGTVWLCPLQARFNVPFTKSLCQGSHLWAFSSQMSFTVIHWVICLPSRFQRGHNLQVPCSVWHGSVHLCLLWRSRAGPSALLGKIFTQWMQYSLLVCEVPGGQGGRRSKARRKTQEALGWGVAKVSGSSSSTSYKVKESKHRILKIISQCWPWEEP